MDSLFQGMGEMPNAEATSIEKDDAVNKKKAEKKEKLKLAMQETMATDPNYIDKVRKLSDSLEVVKTLGAGDGGNIIRDKAKSSADHRELVSTSKIVGYRVRNIGSEPISYMTEEFAKNEEGIFVGTQVKKTLNPGETADLTRQYMTMLCCQPEFSFTLANGKIIMGSAAKSNSKTVDLKKELETYYFKFTANEGEEAPQVNDDTVKLSVDEKVGDKMVVKPEFEATFGYLNNPKEGRRGGRKASEKSGLTAQDYSANYVANLLKSSGMM